MNLIYRLVYYSRNHIPAVGDSFEHEIEDILEKSRVNNQRDQITGALLFNSGCFAQVLEGPLPHLETTFERIQQDERHGEVFLLALEPIQCRSFPNWAMGFVGASLSNAKRFDSVGEQSGFDPSLLAGEKIHAILKELAIEEERG